MIPHLSIHEQLMLERVRERQREAKQQQMLASLCSGSGNGTKWAAAIAFSSCATGSSSSYWS